MGSGCRDAIANVLYACLMDESEGYHRAVNQLIACRLPFAACPNNRSRYDCMCQAHSVSNLMPRGISIRGKMSHIREIKKPRLGCLESNLQQT